MAGLVSKSKKYCSVPQCSTTKVNGISYHLFPNEKRLQKAWQTVLKIGKPVSKYMCVCSLHFEQDAYILPGKISELVIITSDYVYVSLI
jgi:hypothetical protein